jgi:hypothetical protein
MACLITGSSSLKHVSKEIVQSCENWQKTVIFSVATVEFMSSEHSGEVI